MDSPLIRTISEQGQRERAAILERAEAEAEAILAAARAEAETLLSRTPVAAAPPPGDPRLAETTEHLLLLYRERTEALRERVRQHLAGLGTPTRLALVASVLREVLADLPAGAYEVTAPAPVLAAWDHRPDRPLTSTACQGEDATVASADGSMQVRVNLASLVDRAFADPRLGVARRLLIDESD